MNCKYSYKKEDSPYLYCNISNQMCPMMKYCHKYGSYVSSDNYNINCKYYQGKEVNNMERKKGELVVRLVKDNVLYVELGDVHNQVVRVNNPYSYNPTHVNLEKVDNIYYVKGFEPKPLKKEKKEYKPEPKVEEKTEDGKRD